MDIKTRSDGSVKSVQLAFDVLEAVAASQEEVGVSELAAHLGTTKGTVFRHLQTLMERGYVDQNQTSSRYKLGMRSYFIGQTAAARIEILSASTEAVSALRDEIGETVVVSALRGTSLIVLRTVFGKSTLEIGVREGSELVLHGTAQGKIALAFSRKPLLQGVLRKGLEPITEHTITDPAAFDKELQLARAQGYVTAANQETFGINALAAPILDQTGDLVGTIAIVGSVQNIKHDPSHKQVEALLKASLRISWNLGYDKMTVSGRQP
ncbi:IclR family transcriptional regulator [Rhizobium leguminosarum]|uniref:IclR family transcriptional regulator n=1 Tax=Rhizobium leguminosarum TaxID=384 RepID=A0A2K9ZCI5_RHILE|nr:IclR family transcriptional regulator [Rhizobium leguminosarum]AUW45928.1 IclR family transcriptional regulator [Rhizobium leguminosarum]TBC86597.1 IclR family transcriptional regulator [Rhizobium leguminosarum]